MLKKIGTAEHIADTLMKAVDAETLRYHVESSNAECRQDRHHIAPTIAEEHIDDKNDCAED